MQTAAWCQRSFLLLAPKKQHVHSNAVGQLEVADSKHKTDVVKHPMAVPEYRVISMGKLCLAGGLIVNRGFQGLSCAQNHR